MNIKIQILTELFHVAYEVQELPGYQDTIGRTNLTINKCFISRPRHCG